MAAKKKRAKKRGRIATHLVHTHKKSKAKIKQIRWGNFSLKMRLLLILLALFLVWWISSFAIAVWYINKHSHEPLEYGVTFIPSYARDFGLDPKETMDALTGELGIKRFRFVSYWKEIEKQPGVYDFTELDWQFERVKAVGGTVSLAMGLRQPRWPECHAPAWAENLPREQWYPELKKYMVQVINRYQDHPNLVSYQLENEYFLGVFGECQKFGTDRERLIEEFNLVKSYDKETPIILSFANNYFGIPTGQPRPDQFGISVYKRVFEDRFLRRYFEYPFPAWYYAWRSGLTEIFTGKDSMLHELQAEPWGPKPVKEMSIAEQSRSMNVQRLKDRFSYSKATGYRDIDLWGAEWWYWRKVRLGDPSLWDTARDELNAARGISPYK